ncbi:hypothetical protein POTOM_014352 [Populus tomentosa]|uniref:Plant self-incompatibility S1 n=1 Tax=Populus tomentosa TaxID=118781 RepID=A0A8X8D8E6_POPTO|nr:hypothetical protein POTOM_014352 [Populus tomentosa]
MTSWINFLLFLVLQLCFLSAATTNEHDDHPLPTVHVINALPKSSKAMNVSCSSNTIDIGEQSLVNGEVYKWRVSQRKLHYCVAIWERFFASWHAFQPRRDGNHETLFWMVEEDGFFISWDKAKWILMHLVQKETRTDAAESISCGLSGRMGSILATGTAIGIGRINGDGSFPVQ